MGNRSPEDAVLARIVSKGSFEEVTFERDSN